MSTNSSDPAGLTGDSRNRGEEDNSDQGTNSRTVLRAAKPKSRSDSSSTWGDRARLRIIAKETLSVLEESKYVVDGITYDLKEATKHVAKHTNYFAPDCFLSQWASPRPAPSSNQAIRSPCTIRLEEKRTLSAACHIHHSRDSLGLDFNNRIGVLNFASAKKEGGGFINGARAQEESIARSSTLHPSLMSPEAQRYYKLHRAQSHGGYYTNAMIYSRNVHIIRDDDPDEAKWHPPVIVDVLTSPAVNAKVVLNRVTDVEAEKEEIKKVMVERMARILFLFEHKGMDAIVLGSFGTGAFGNDVDTIAGIWKNLLGPGGRFADSFRHITFGVIPNETFTRFKHILGSLET